MASLATYAKLTPPAQFVPHPGVNVLFRLQYSEDLTSKYATLIIDGYSLTEDTTGNVYDGYKETHLLGWAIAGQWYSEYYVNSGLLGIAYPERTGNLYTSGKMQARVEIGNETDEDGHVINPVFTSNVTLVDMIITRDNPPYFIGVPYNANASVFGVSPYCDYILSMGADGSADIQSYRIFLYDENYNQVRDSEELYDWDNNIYGNSSYKFYDLKDDKTYYTKFRITLNGGTSFTSAYEPINVHYDTIPSGSDEFELIPRLGNVQMKLDLSGVTHTKVVFSRTVQDESDYLELVTVENPGSSVTAIDKYPIPGRAYTYRAVVLNGELIVGTYYGNILFTSSYITISDAMGSYSAVGNITKHPINRNDRGSILETMDNKFPYQIINGDADYDSGQITGMFSTVDDDCAVEMDNKALSNALRAWLNNGRAKLLTYYTGEAWIVAVNGISTTDPENNDVYNTSFNWTAIGDASIVSDYVRLGLVIDE